VGVFEHGLVGKGVFCIQKESVYNVSKNRRS
jgi:hypothetical protein